MEVVYWKEGDYCPMQVHVCKTGGTGTTAVIELLTAVS